jgi:hypothetical protein
MAGLTDQAGGTVERAQQAWQESMLRQMDELRSTVQAYNPERLARQCGAVYSGSALELRYWLRPIEITWPELSMTDRTNNTALSVFDAAAILYYLRQADGEPFADRWVSFRELPGGGFYHQAFQGYSGDNLAQCYATQPELLHQAARKLEGWPLSGLPGIAYAFLPLPCIRLAAILYPGDEEFPTTARILFDAAASHYTTIDGLAMLGSGLASRLIRNYPTTGTA